jgi:phosphoribosylaminoimidazole (AIR) synthetase
MNLSKKDARKMIERLRQSNEDYLVKTFDLREDEAEFLLEAWKIYTKERPEVLKQAPIRSLDCFVHGYLAHVELARKRKSVLVISPPARVQK